MSTLDAPESLASFAAAMPIGPLPCTSTVSPMVTPAFTTEKRAVAAGSTMAPLSKLTLSGSGNTCRSGMMMYSA